MRLSQVRNPFFIRVVPWHEEVEMGRSVARWFDSKVTRNWLKRDSLQFLQINNTGGPGSVMAKTPDSHARGPGFQSWCRPTNFGAHLPYTPPPGRKDASRVPKGMVYANAEHQGWQKILKNVIVCPHQKEQEVRWNHWQLWIEQGRNGPFGEIIAPVRNLPTSNWGNGHTYLVNVPCHLELLIISC